MNETPAPVVIRAAYIDRYGFAIVEVEPYRHYSKPWTVEVTRFVDYPENKGQWPVGEGYAVKKDGTVGKRKIVIGRTPAIVRAAAVDMYA